MKVSHSELTLRAHQIVIQDLEAYGNKLSANHSQALYALQAAMTEQASGRLPGRYAFSLPTGTGKTSSITAWCQALYELGESDVSVAISASKVEELCSLKRALISHGIPDDQIGLLHSYKHDQNKGVVQGKYASEPATRDNEDRRIMLVTHARVRGGGSGLELYSNYKGKPRSLLVFDESLIVSDSFSIQVREMNQGLGFVKHSGTNNKDCLDAIAFAEDALGRINEVVSSGKDATLVLPYASAEDLMRYTAAIYSESHGKSDATEALRELIQHSQESVRICALYDGGMLNFEITVPSVFTNMLILDASYPIRELERLDSTIQDILQTKFARRFDVDWDNLKRWEQVQIHHMKAASGRTSIKKQFEPRDRSASKVVQDVLKVITELPANESVLVFVFKDRRENGRVYRYRTKLEEHLEAAGVDIEQTIDGKKRINIITWGHETGRNDWSHCQNVVLVGVLEKGHQQHMADYAGQTNNLESEQSTKIINRLAMTEICHLVYQAASRGCARITQDGKAQAMKLWLICRLDVKEELAQVMPGANWTVWTGNYSRNSKQENSMTQKIVRMLHEYFGSDWRGRISVSQVYKALGATELHSKTRQRARDQFLTERPEIKLEGRSFVDSESVALAAFGAV